jgi:Winged helix-turn-helix DNA-binding
MGFDLTTNFACLNSIVRKSYGEDNKKATLQADRIKSVEGKILKLIILNGIYGISHKDLADTVGLDRKNLRRYTKRLMKRNLITRASGKQGKYFPIADVYQDATLGANFFSEISMSKILPVENYTVPNDYDSTYSKYFHPKFTEESGLARTLFEFSNKIGAFITYILIQAMNPKNEHTINSKEKDIDKDALVQEWIEIAISSIIRFLPQQFKDSIGCDLVVNSFFPLDLDRKKIEDRIADYILKRPQFHLNDNFVYELSQAFKELYPLIKYQLDEVLEKLPLAVDNYKVREDHYHEMARIQNTCKHEYRIAKDRLVKLHGYRHWIPNDEKIKHCPKCHRTKFPKSKH